MGANEFSGPTAILKLPGPNPSLILFAKAVHDALLGNGQRQDLPEPQPHARRVRSGYRHL